MRKTPSGFNIKKSPMVLRLLGDTFGDSFYERMPPMQKIISPSEHLYSFGS
ncbi:MAG: hypothetical protein Q4D65_05035 [Peptostreptococcaceae bacterium]|nr:hypothetical protein [Peptostreptococcaceae bacterium]